MSHRTCSVDGCENKFHAKDFCSKHYSRWKRHGDANYIPPPPATTCKLEGCDRPVNSKGICSMHVKRWKKHGSYEKRSLRNTCKVEECGLGAYGRGYCRKHYQRVRHHGTPDLLPKGRKVCVIEGCDEFRVGRGWCIKHYTRWQRNGDPEYRLAGEVVNGRRICPRCGEDCLLSEFYNDRTVYCRRCSRARAREYQSQNRRLAPRKNLTCFTCRKDFLGTKRNRTYCSRECLEKGRHERNYPNVLKRQLRFSVAKKEHFQRIDIFERDNWTCGICNEQIDSSRKRPDPLSPSIDHIIPISRGGDHTRENVQAAHLGCNVSKGVSIPESLEGEQWRNDQLSLF